MRTVLGSVVVLLLVVASLPAATAEEPAQAELPISADALAAFAGPRQEIGLREAVRMAVRANLAIKAGSYNPSMAMEAFRIQTAAFDPLLSATFDYSHDQQPVTSTFFGRPVVTEDRVSGSAGISKRLRTGGTVSFLYSADRLDTDSGFIQLNPAWTQGAILEATQPILRGAGYVAMADIRLARNDLSAADHSQRARIEQVLLEVVEAYWILVYTQREEAARIKSEGTAAELLRDAQARLDAEVGTPLDVAEARAGLERRKGDRIQSQASRSLAQDVLRVLILPFSSQADGGVAFVAKENPQGTSGMAPEMDELERYTRLALTNRPEIRASKANLSNRDIDVFVASNAVKPQLDVVARAGSGGLDGDYGSSFGELVQGQALSGAIGLQFSMFIGRKAARSGLRMAEWARRQAKVVLKDLENHIIAEVRSGVREVVTAQAVEQAGIEQVRASEEDLRGERQLLSNGRSTPFRVLQKEDDLTDARTRLARSSTNRRIAEARFWRAVGFLGQKLGVDEKSPVPQVASGSVPVPAPVGAPMPVAPAVPAPSTN